MNSAVCCSLLELDEARCSRFKDSLKLYENRSVVFFSQGRLAKVENGTNLDWSTAEAMAFGSLLCQGQSTAFYTTELNQAVLSWPGSASTLVVGVS